MCGRVYSGADAAAERMFALTARDWSAWISKLFTDSAEPDVRYNVAPSRLIPVLHLDHDGEIQLSMMRWGLTPFWASADKPGKPMANARSETVWEKSMFKRAMKERRCLMLVNGFYEWKRDGTNKTPWFIRMKHGGMSMGGIWQTGKDGVKECCNLTTGPNSFMEPLHDRMPVIIPDDSVDIWLKSDDQSALNTLMLPCPSEWIEGWSVPSYVNSSRNDGAMCIERRNV